MNKKLKVMIVDDTILYRKILKDIIIKFPTCEVISTASNGKFALSKFYPNIPDLVLLDVEMPVMDGLETLKQIKKLYPSTGVIMVSGVNERQALITMKALSIGAIDFVPKPIGGNVSQNIKTLFEDLKPLINIFYSQRFPQKKPARIARTIAKPSSRTMSPKPTPIKRSFPTLPSRIDVLVIGISTGGPNALAKFIPMLPANLGVPVLLVQHMPATFTKSLAKHLDSKSMLTVVEASDGQIIENNVVYIAPGSKHMIIKNDKISIIDTPPVNSCKPSVDVLFDSIPSKYKNNVVSLIMTGMGSDGMKGVRTLRKHGCYSITQSEESCVVYGMPRAVDEADLSDENVPLNSLAKRVVEIVRFGPKR